MYQSDKSEKIENPLDVNINKNKTTYDFYQDGFSFLEIKDSIDHNLESKCYLYRYNVTPEKLLVSIAQRYKVIGISATCTYKTVVNNYDLAYFNYVLKKKFSIITKEEANAIQNNYQTRINDVYTNSKIEVKFIEYYDDYDDVLECFEKFMHQTIPELADKYFWQIKRLLEIREEKDYRYLLQILLNVFQVYKEFTRDSEVHSFLYFMTFNPERHHIIGKVFTEIMIDLKEACNGSDFICMNSLTYANCYSDYKKTYLEQGKDLFIITTYQTLGTGINLQYNVTEEVKRVYPGLSTIKKDKGNYEKDIDGIYLSKPTNIIPHLDPNYNDYKTLAKTIYALEYLRAGNVIDKKIFDKNVRNAFSIALLNKNQPLNIGQYKYNIDISYGIVKCIVQAIGRICRTQNKGSKICVYSSSENAQFLLNIKHDIKHRINNKEFNELLFKSTEIHAEVKNNTPDIDECRAIIKKGDQRIKSLCQRKWTKENIIIWNSLREFVLKFPTIDNDHNHYVRNYYFHFKEPVSEYSFDNQYYIRTISNGTCHCRRCVSLQESGLYWLLERMDGLKDYFYKRGYATKFEKNEYIMAPNVFQAIYKGTVGEVVGRFIMEKYHIPIHEITDVALFEKFDFSINKAVYLDFKNWRPDFEVDKDSQLTKINRKANGKMIKKIFVINIVYNGFKDMQTYHYNDVDIYTIPWLFDTYKCIYNLEAIDTILKEIRI